MKNIWLMKTYSEWAERFLNSNEPFVALDEDGVDGDYSALTNTQRQNIFNRMKEIKDRRWGHIKRFFDEFYDVMQTDDIIVLGTGQKTKFLVTAILVIEGNVDYLKSDNSWDSRHRRKVRILWKGDPFEFKKWGWANRLEKLDTPERLKQFIEMYISIKK